ncbi:hypothetical protein LINPERHAP1_LOCUS24144 [Linum perenne]
MSPCEKRDNIINLKLLQPIYKVTLTASIQQNADEKAAATTIS